MGPVPNQRMKVARVTNGRALPLSMEKFHGFQSRQVWPRWTRTGYQCSAARPRMRQVEKVAIEALANQERPNQNGGR